MKKILRLVSVQLWAVLGDVLSIGNKKKNTKGLYVGFAAFTLLISAVSFFYSLMIGAGLMAFDAIDILPSLMMAVACLVLLITTTFQIKGTIFGFKDYDMVMSLPISTAGVVASRLLILYIINIMFVVILIGPMMIAYGILARPGFLFYLLGLVSILFIPMLPIILASVVGTVIAYAASRFRHSNILNIIFSIGLIVIIICMSFTFQGDEQDLVNMGKGIADAVNSFYPIAGLYTEAIVNYNIPAFLLFAGISVLSFGLYTFLVKSIFTKVNTAMMTGSYRRRYKLGKLKTATPFGALYRKELSRYFASSVYVINTSIGVVLLTIGAIAILFIDITPLLSAGVPTKVLAVAVPLMIGFCLAMSSTTMASISLEGKNFWIMKSLPVTPRMIYASKVAVNLTLLAPALFDTVLIGVALSLEPILIILMILMTCALGVFIALYGLVINLLLPNFNWNNETVVVKQSAASMIVIFSGFGMMGIQFAVLFLIPSAVLGYLVFTALVVLMDAALYFMLHGYGTRRYAQL